MAIKLIANYSKRLGLPGYSSHQFEVSIETEIGNTSELDFAAERLYSSLQSAVDAQIRQVGFVPDASYGSGSISGAPVPAMRQVPRITMQSSADNRPAPNSDNPAWHCSEKQKQVILSLARKSGMNDSALHDLAVLCFGKGVSQLNKLEASSLIKELIEKSGGDIPQGFFLRQLCPAPGGSRSWNTVNIRVSPLPEPFHGGLRQRAFFICCIQGFGARSHLGFDYRNTSCKASTCSMADNSRS